MKTQLSLIAALGLSVTGCLAKTNAVCQPANSWHLPLTRCTSTMTAMQEPEPEPELAPEPEPAPEPTVRVAEDRIEIMQKVLFETNSAEIRSESYGLLDDVARTLEENPDIKKVRVEGHTDSRGSASLNRRLSNDRAKSVRRYLVDRGIDGDRLTAKGYGPDVPIDDNSTEAGRERNRRVEFKILERE